MGRDDWLRGWLGRPGLWADDKQRKEMTEKESWFDQEKKGKGLNLFEGSNKFESSSSLECGYLT